MTIALAGLCGLRLLPALSAPVASSHGESGPWLKTSRKSWSVSEGIGVPSSSACLPEMASAHRALPGSRSVRGTGLFH